MICVRLDLSQCVQGETLNSFVRMVAELRYRAIEGGKDVRPGRHTNGDGLQSKCDL